MTARTMGKRLRVMEDKLITPEFIDVRLVSEGPETDAMIAASRARGEKNVQYIVLRALTADD